MFTVLSASQSQQPGCPFRSKCSCGPHGEQATPSNPWRLQETSPHTASSPVLLHPRNPALRGTPFPAAFFSSFLSSSTHPPSGGFIVFSYAFSRSAICCEQRQERLWIPPLCAWFWACLQFFQLGICLYYGILSLLSFLALFTFRF